MANVMTTSTSEYTKRNYISVNKNYTHSSNNIMEDSYYSNDCTILHQNIQGLKNKIDEFLLSLSHNEPQVICSTEHHLRTDEIVSVNFGHYTLGSAFCRQFFKRGGVCISIANHISFKPINLEQFCKEKDFESCALEISLSLSSNCFIIIGIYRAPTGNFAYFLNQLESILNIYCKTSTHIILCGDFNVDYSDDNSKKFKLDTLLASFGLFGIVKFPTRTTYQSCTQIDNIFINTYSMVQSPS